MAQEIQRNVYGVLALDASLALFRFSRTPEVFPCLEEASSFFGAMYEAMASYGARRYRILLDLRQGPLRTDPAFEEVVRCHHQQVCALMVRVAILIASPLGVLQMMRQRREGWSLGMLFNDEAEALAFLTEDLPALLPPKKTTP